MTITPGDVFTVLQALVGIVLLLGPVVALLAWAVIEDTWQAERTEREIAALEQGVAEGRRTVRALGTGLTGTDAPR